MRAYTVCDRLWLWCHPAGCHTRSPEQHGIVGHSTIEPAAAAAYLAIPNALFVRYELTPPPPFESYARPLASMHQVVWSVEGGGGGDVDAALALTKTLPNLRGIILDDYFARVAASDGDASDGPFSLEAMRQLRRRLDACKPRLDAWVVLYTHEFDHEAKLRPHLELCDVVTMWTWNAAELAHLGESFTRFERIVGGKRRILGIYLWDYGAKQAMPLDAMERQCSLGLRWLREHRIDGMIFLASCICDLGLEAVEWARRWIAENGETPV
jgi:hypothetical protein